MSCNHKFQGHKNGVTCLLCGLRMTPKEYAEYLTPSKPKEVENISDVSDELKTPAEEPKEEPVDKPKAPPKKSQKTPKKEGGKQ